MHERTYNTRQPQLRTSLHKSELSHVEVCCDGAGKKTQQDFLIVLTI